MKYTPTIGLEIHLQLNTRSKMFCSCSNTGETEPPNTTVCPTCMGHPGTLPRVNAEAINMTILAGYALHCSIHSPTKFDRKNYFYPDLSKGYQISQFDIPLCYEGHLILENGKKIGITRIHMEEDTAKLLHSNDTSASLVDFNRCGSPLMELVTEPQISSAAEAKEFCQELQRIFRFLEISDADMEKGHMRCEANISVRPPRQKKLGTKVEVKNINSFRALEKAIDYEIVRQSACYDQGEKIKQETRGWNEKTEQTVSQRSKEEAHDYRYFPEPDIPPLEFEPQKLDRIKNSVPELPIAKRKRLQQQYGFQNETCFLFSENKFLSAWVEHVMSEVQAWLEDFAKETSMEKDPMPRVNHLVAGWITSELFKLMNEDKRRIQDIAITPENFAEFISLLFLDKINSTTGQKILKEMYNTGADPCHIMVEKNWGKIENELQLATIVEQILSENPDQVAKYRQGKTALMQFFIGQGMKKTSGQADPALLKNILEKKLSQ